MRAIYLATQTTNAVFCADKVNLLRKEHYLLKALQLNDIFIRHVHEQYFKSYTYLIMMVSDVPYLNLTKYQKYFHKCVKFFTR